MKFCSDPTRRTMLATGFGLAGGAVLASFPSIAGDRPPSRDVRLIVPFTPAGATDLLARGFGDALAKRTGRMVVVENRPGAGGNLGAELAARAAADGHTLLIAPLTIYAAGTTLQPTRAFDLVRDFAPVATLARVPHVLVASPGLGVADVPALIRAARERPGRIVLASQGVGTISHLEGALFQHMAGVEFTHVPYKGSAPALLDLAGGRVQIMFDSVAAALPQIRAGRLRALAVTTAARTAILPEIPTVAEDGIPGYAAESWVGILVPAQTPRADVDRLAADCRAVVADAVLSARLAGQGFEVDVRTGADVDALIRREIAHWAAVIRRAGIVLR